MLWSYDKLPLSPAPSSPAVFIIRQNKPWSSEVILPGVRRCRSYRAGNKQNSSYNDVILSPSSHKQPSVRWAQKHDNLFPAFNCTLSRVVLFNILSLNTINSNIQIFSPRFGDTLVSGHFLTRRAVPNILAITVTTLLLPRPLSVVWKVLTSGCHHVVTIMGCHHVVTSPVSRLAHVSRVCVMSCEQRQKWK